MNLFIGTFQNIEHVFVVGVSGGVPHFTDYYKHVKLGDIVMSQRNDKGYVYYHCDKILKDNEDNNVYKLRTFAPREFVLQNLVEKLHDRNRRKPDKAPWEKYIYEGLDLLRNQEADFNRPPTESKRLYMKFGEDNLIVVNFLWNQMTVRPSRREFRMSIMVKLVPVNKSPRSIPPDLILLINTTSAVLMQNLTKS